MPIEFYTLYILNTSQRLEREFTFFFFFKKKDRGGFQRRIALKYY